jgi:hypothetical protein
MQEHKVAALREQELTVLKSLEGEFERKTGRKIVFIAWEPTDTGHA